MCVCVRVCVGVWTCVVLCSLYRCCYSDDERADVIDDDIDDADDALWSRDVV